MIDIHVNGESRRFDGPLSVDELLDALGIGRDGVAVEVNRVIVPRRSHVTTALESGDEIEIVTFVGGG